MNPINEKGYTIRVVRSLSSRIRKIEGSLYYGPHPDLFGFRQRDSSGNRRFRHRLGRHNIPTGIRQVFTSDCIVLEETNPGLMHLQYLRQRVDGCGTLC